MGGVSSGQTVSRWAIMLSYNTNNPAKYIPLNILLESGAGTGALIQLPKFADTYGCVYDIKIQFASFFLLAAI